MEPEGSIPCLQEPSTGSCPEPDKSSPYYPILFLQNPSKYYSTIYVLVYEVVSFFAAFSPITNMNNVITITPWL
jgi:hypothetical protein